MIIKNATYIKGAAKYEQCIVSDVIQIAVAGKSNVGKSSFINYLVGDGKLARTSKLPGRTRLINYFLINDGREDEFILADLPGYGFAKVSDAEKLKWADLLEKYLAKEQMLKHVFFLVDIRHDPTKDDVTMYNYLFKNNVPFTIVATKADKIAKSQVKNRLRSLANFFKVGEGDLLAVSSTDKTGKEAVLERIDKVVRASRFFAYGDFVLFNSDNAKLIEMKDVYPDGANSPTTRYEYECLCGRGKIIYERVGGFDDSYAFFECDECESKYHLITGCGHFWEYKKK